MTFLIQGFLSDDSHEVRQTVRDRYASYRNALLRLNEQCVAAQYVLAIQNDDPRELLGAAYYMRTIASTQAAVLLLENGLISQAKTVLRSALEALFGLAAIEAKPELAELIAASQDADKRSLADKMLLWEDELKASRDSRISEDELLELKASDAREFKLWQLAEAAGMTSWYRSLYALLSQPAHVTVSDLLSHTVVDGNGSIIEMKSLPEIDDQESTWAFVMEVQIRAAKAITNMFNLQVIDIPTHEGNLRTLVS